MKTGKNNKESPENSTKRVKIINELRTAFFVSLKIHCAADSEKQKLAEEKNQMTVLDVCGNAANAVI